MTADCDLSAALLVYAVPARTDLSPEQNAGAHCVRCGGTVPPEPGTDLGGLGGRSPHGCSACYEVQRAWLRTCLKWSGHVRACSACRTGCS
jgi:hypothetical protein